MRELQFTGNWFIDAGILGFVNLMEEVYGWDLEELRSRSRKEPEIVYYGYFPFAYFYKLSKKKDEKLKKELINFIEKNKNNLGRDIIKEVWWKYITELFREAWIEEKLRVPESKLYDKKGNVKPEYRDCNYVKLVKSGEHEELKEYLNKVWDTVKSKNISKEKSRFCRIPVSDSFYKNFLFFNPSRGIYEQLEDLKNLIDSNTSHSKYLSKIDKTISKFLPSDDEFPNASYTEFRVDTIAKEVPYLFVYLINFRNAFIDVENRNKIFFYSSDLDFTYRVNKKIRVYLTESKEASDKKILRITWQAIVDGIVETETVWSLENMYLIKYEGIISNRQELQGVEYIGIPKLQASIIIDDTLRDTINTRIPTRASNGNIEDSVWLLEEFVSNKPMLPHLIRYIYIYTKPEKINNFAKTTVIYASMIDAKIVELGKENRVFSEKFFEKYREITTKIKEDIRWAFTVTKSQSNLFTDMDENRSLANLLLSKIRRNNKYGFVNLLLKALTEKAAEIDAKIAELEKKDAQRAENAKETYESIRNVNNFVFNKILLNDISWKNYALVLVAGLLKRTDEEGGEENE